MTTLILERKHSGIDYAAKQVQLRDRKRSILQCLRIPNAKTLLMVDLPHQTESQHRTKAL